MNYDVEYLKVCQYEDEMSSFYFSIRFFPNAEAHLKIRDKCLQSPSAHMLRWEGRGLCSTGTRDRTSP